MKKFIFLDVDGVFNVQNYEEARGVSSFMPIAVDHFNWLLSRHKDAKVIMTSTWRDDVLNGNMNLTGMEVLLRSHGLKMQKRLIGVTPRDKEDDDRRENIRRGHRGQQIHSWLFHFAYGQEYAMCVIDDCPVGMDFKPYDDFVVNVSGHIGLTREDVEQADALLRLSPLEIIKKNAPL